MAMDVQATRPTLRVIFAFLHVRLPRELAVRHGGQLAAEQPLGVDRRELALRERRDGGAARPPGVARGADAQAEKSSRPAGRVTSWQCFRSMQSLFSIARLGGPKAGLRWLEVEFFAGHPDPPVDLLA